MSTHLKVTTMERRAATCMVTFPDFGGRYSFDSPLPSLYIHSGLCPSLYFRFKFLFSHGEQTSKCHAKEVEGGVTLHEKIGQIWPTIAWNDMLPLRLTHVCLSLLFSSLLPYIFLTYTLLYHTYHPPSLLEEHTKHLI